jgi:hypothetical protein
MSGLRTPQNTRTDEGSLDYKKLEAGLLGKLFGTGDNAAKNIAGITIVALMGVFIYLVIKGIDNYTDTVKTFIVPVITLALGYLFGTKNSGGEM